MLSKRPFGKLVFKPPQNGKKQKVLTLAEGEPLACIMLTLLSFGVVGADITRQFPPVITLTTPPGHVPAKAVAQQRLGPYKLRPGTLSEGRPVYECSNKVTRGLLRWYEG